LSEILQVVTVRAGVLDDVVKDRDDAVGVVAEPPHDTKRMADAARTVRPRKARLTRHFSGKVRPQGLEP
jgi:hypothetical protein